MPAHHDRFLLALASLAVLGLCSISPNAVLAEEGDLARFDGTFLYSGGARERAAGEQAVELVVAEFNVLFRGLARRHLLEVVTPWPRLVLKCVGAELSIDRGEKIPAKVALGAAPQDFTNRMGDRASVKRHLAKGALVEVISDGKSSQTNTFRVSPDGKRLTILGHVASPQLPRDLRFTFTYSRQD